jgi:hypothetical protein
VFGFLLFVACDWDEIWGVTWYVFQGVANFMCKTYSICILMLADLFAVLLL